MAISPHMSSQYGELWPTSSWDLLASLGHPSKFQWVSPLGSVTARHSSSGRQANSAALNRLRHLYLAGRPSRWALARILVSNYFDHLLIVLLRLVFPWRTFYCSCDSEADMKAWMTLIQWKLVSMIRNIAGAKGIELKLWYLEWIMIPNTFI